MNIWASSSDKYMGFSFSNGPGLYQGMQYSREEYILQTPTTNTMYVRVRELKRLASEKERKESRFYVSNGKELNFGHNTKRRSEGKHEYVLTKSQVFKKML